MPPDRKVEDGFLSPQNAAGDGAKKREEEEERGILLFFPLLRTERETRVGEISSFTSPPPSFSLPCFEIESCLSFPSFPRVSGSGIRNSNSVGGKLIESLSLRRLGQKRDIPNIRNSPEENIEGNLRVLHFKILHICLGGEGGREIGVRHKPGAIFIGSEEEEIFKF